MKPSNSLACRLALAALSTFAFTGCASIVTGHNQTVSVETLSDAGPISGGRCRLSNDKGLWYVTTPGSTMVHRSINDLSIKCEREGFEPGTTLAKSTTKPMVFGNAIFGGLIGVGVDVATGAAYDYPGFIRVSLGRRTGPVESPPSGDAGAEQTTAPALPKRGDVLEYVVQDRFTNATRQVRWRVDEVDGARVVFNGGERIESVTGAPLAVTRASAGDMDALEPPDGWIPAKLALGDLWTVKYTARDGFPPSEFDLTARAVEHVPVDTPAGRFETVFIEYEGWRMVDTIGSPQAATFRIWFEPKERRIVLFESTIGAGQSGPRSSPSRERTELVRWARVDQ